MLRPGDAAVFKNIVVLLPDPLLHPLDAPLAQHELHAGGVLVLAVAILVEDPDDGLDAVQQALFGDELL